MGHRPGHHDMAAGFIPVDSNRTAIHDNPVGGRTTPGPRHGHANGAGAAATGHGDADPAFPDAHAETAIGKRADHGKIDPLRKQRRGLDPRSDGGKINRLGILDKDNRMRVAKGMTDSWVQPVDPKRHGKRVRLMRQRHLVPASRHRTHIHRDLAVAGVIHDPLRDEVISASAGDGAVAAHGKGTVTLSAGGKALLADPEVLALVSRVVARP